MRVTAIGKVTVRYGYANVDRKHLLAKRLRKGQADSLRFKVSSVASSRVLIELPAIYKMAFRHSTEAVAWEETFVDGRCRYEADVGGHSKSVLGRYVTWSDDLLWIPVAVVTRRLGEGGWTHVFERFRWGWPEFLAKVGRYVAEVPDDNGEYHDGEA